MNILLNGSKTVNGRYGYGYGYGYCYGYGYGYTKEDGETEEKVIDVLFTNLF